MSNEQALNLICEALRDGDSFGSFDYWSRYYNEPVRFPTFSAVLYKYNSRGREYVGWSYFGSSAWEWKEEEPATAVMWILEKIFEMSPLEFLTKYPRKSALIEAARYLQ